MQTTTRHNLKFWADPICAERRRVLQWLRMFQTDDVKIRFSSHTIEWSHSQLKIWNTRVNWECIPEARLFGHEHKCGRVWSSWTLNCLSFVWLFSSSTLEKVGSRLVVMLYSSCCIQYFILQGDEREMEHSSAWWLSGRNCTVMKLLMQSEIYPKTC